MITNVNGSLRHEVNACPPRLMAALSIVLIVSAATYAAGWSSIPSLKTPVRAMTACKGRLFAGTVRNGIFVSSDGGREWTSADSGLPADGSPFQRLRNLPGGQSGRKQ